MCGLAGYLSFSAAPLTPDVLRGMGDAMAHRGPDHADIWQDQDGRIGLSHRRLSIMDLSLAGAQPMASHSGRYVMVYNGAVYNHPTLREELDQGDERPWRGGSDTETMLALFDAVGVEAAMPRFTGMFAFAVWDREARTLTLARDRLGEKPLYYGTDQGRFLFASDLIAFSAVPGFSPAISAPAAQAMLDFACIPTPLCIFEGFYKLPAGSCLTIDNLDDPVAATPRPYWSLADSIEEAAPSRAADVPYAQLVDETERVLRQVVQSQLLSDVPVGSFLSGGVDSSLITALMQQEGGGEVLTFSIGFETARFNEAEQAREVAKVLGTRHHETILTERDALDVIPQLPSIYAEPFADSSQIPTVLLSRITQQHVGVALSGDGGDELFGGYNRHVMGPGYWQKARRIPAPLRRAGAAGIQAIQGLLSRSPQVAALTRRMGLPVSTLDKLAQFSDSFGQARSLRDLYGGLIGTSARDAALPALCTDMPGLTDAEQMMFWDSLWYLPDDIMVKVDRASMSTSLETRAPFLDLNTIDQAWSLPQSARIAPGTGKRILRDILYRHVPKALVDRPKQGFSIPFDAWLRGDLRDFAGDLLANVKDLEAFGIDPIPIRQQWQAHTTGRANYGAKLWHVLMLLQWLSARKT